MEARNLAEALAEDLAELGLAELVSPGELRSLDGSTRVELEQEGDLISIFENGDEIAQYSTSDDDFDTRFMGVVATSLNF